MILFSKDNSFIKVDSIDSNTMEYSYFDSYEKLKKRERFVNDQMTYSYSIFGDSEMIIEYNKNGVIQEFKIKSLTKHYFVKHLSFTYNSIGEIVEEIDNLNGTVKTYHYSYK